MELRARSGPKRRTYAARLIKGAVAIVAIAVLREEGVRVRIVRAILLEAPTNMLVARQIGVIAFRQIVIVEGAAKDVVTRVDFLLKSPAVPPRPPVPEAA